MNLTEIREHWEAQGRAFPATGTVTPTSRDPFLARLEQDNIAAFLAPDMTVLEVGCGDAMHTIAYARKVHGIEALDVAPSIIQLARTRIERAQVANVRLTCASVLDIEKLYPQGSFHSVISQRCLINLPSWEYQREALRQMASLLRPGGLLLLSEGFDEPLAALNEARVGVGLRPIQVVPYNRNLRCSEFEAEAARSFDTREVRDYGAYLFLSRVFHPLAVSPAEPVHDDPLNLAAMELARRLPLTELAKFSYNRFYVLQKR